MENKIKIDKMFDVLIVEKSNGDVIESGSFIYCGCCGNPVCQTKKEISFPFDSNKLKKHCKDWTLQNMPIGVRHKTCGHTMFPFKKSWGFVSLEKYMSDMVMRILGATALTHPPQIDSE